MLDVKGWSVQQLENRLVVFSQRRGLVALCKK